MPITWSTATTSYDDKWDLDWLAGKGKHDLYVDNMGSRCIQSQTSHPEFKYTGNFSRQQVVLVVRIF